MITPAEVDELVDALVEQTRAYVAKSLEGLDGRLGALEDRVGLLALAPGLPGPPGPAGRDVEPVVVAELKAEIAILRARLEHLPVEATATLANLAETVAAGVVTKALATAPAAVDGTNGRDGIDGKDGLDGLHGKDGIDGKDGLAGLNGKDGRDGVDGKDGAAGLNGKDGRDGLGLVDAVIDRAGHLILTGSDGRTKDVGQVVGKDGQDVDPVAVDKRLGDMVAAVLETWPRPRDGVDGKDGLAGLNGKDGRDGVGFDDLEGVFDTRGRLVLRFKRGDYTLEIPVPCLTDQTVWKYGTEYKKGDGVTYDRSFWIAQVDHPRAGPSKTHQAGTTKEWRLAVARGRDSKELIAAETGEGG
jgi:Collagen triple helix repeat (20 copies)